MSQEPEPSFAEFVARIRAGDAQAAAELVRRYEPAIRMEVRVRLRDPRLGRFFDSMDICQSVLATFFIRVAAGQYDLDEPGQLIRLLVGITRKKVAENARKQKAQRRDHRRAEPLDLRQHEVAAAGSTPSQIVAGEELLRDFHKRLGHEERQIADLRAQGHSWDSIAVKLGGTTQARRKQLARAVERVSKYLGIDEADDA
jgi:RNA polymerase sigma-70 factor (ECF subfamily)